MARNTQTNAPEITFDAVVNALLSEGRHKVGQDEQGNKRRMLMLRVCIDYPTKCMDLIRLRNKYDVPETKDEAREEIAKMFRAEAAVTTSSNHIARSIETIRFATHAIEYGYHECIVFNSKGGAEIKGGSKLAHDVWRHLEWATNKVIEKQAKTPDNAIGFVLRAGDKTAGSISWAQLADLVATKAGYKSGGNSAQSRTKVMEKTMKAMNTPERLKVLSSIVNAIESTSITETEGGRVQSAQTAEDLVAMVLGDKPETADLRKKANDFFETLYLALGVQRAKTETKKAA